MNLALYQLLTRLLWLPIYLYLLFRIKKGKEDPKRLKERLGYAEKKRPVGSVIWVHAASVGEAVSVLPLISRLVAEQPTIHILITTGTVTSARLISDRLPANTLHQYVPVDNYDAVRRFLRHWQPDLALWVESELWPNLITETAKHCPILMINGHLSEKSFQFWQRFPLLKKALMQSISLALTQSVSDKERLVQMGAAKVEHLGSLKYDAPPLPASAQAIQAILEATQGRELWLAASTHEGEEAAIANVHIQLKQHSPTLLTIIVPRHPNRAAEIIAQLQDKGLVTAQRSKQQPITPDTDIYVADTMGELGIFFRVANIVFIGASLVPKGGHNPLEPARLGCAIIMGSFIHNCVDICAHMQGQDALIIVQNEAELYSTVAELLGNKEKQEYMITRGLGVIRDTNKITDQYMAEIRPFLVEIKI